MHFRYKSLTISILFWLLLGTVSSALLIWCSERACHGFNLKHVLLIEAVVWFSAVMHIYKELRVSICNNTGNCINIINNTDNNNSISTALGFGPAGAAHDIRYDYIRLFSVFAVIAMHSIDHIMPFLSSEISADTLATLDSIPNGLLYPAAILRVLFYLGNTCFLMLTGALTFGRSANEDLFNFYKHFFSKILIPFVIYFIFYIWQNGMLNPLNYENISNAVHMIASGQIGEVAPFLWLIYMTISIYISIPFLRYMFNAMSYRMLTMLVGIVFICYALRIYLGFTPDILPFFSSWIGVSIIGLWMTRQETRRYDRFILAVAALALIKTVLAVNPYDYWQNYVNYYVHFAPISLFMACGFFSLALHQRASAGHSRFHSLIIMLSRNSYTILLLHWWALYHILIRSWNYSLSWDRPLYFAASVLLIILISLGAGILIDQTVVYAVRTVFEYAADLFRKMLQHNSSSK